jgi:hypothetical protein
MVIRRRRIKATPDALRQFPLRRAVLKLDVEDVEPAGLDASVVVRGNAATLFEQGILYTGWYSSANGG